MRWENERESSNVEDRRSSGASPGGGMGGGGGFQIPMGRGGLGVGTIVVALVGAWLFGINPMTVLDVLGGGGGGGVISAPQQQPQPQVAQQHGGQPAQGAQHASDPLSKFVSVVLASTEDTWQKVFTQSGSKYPPPRLVLFRGRTPTGCGAGETAAGPFYCPADQKLYIDLAFYKIMRDQLGAGGDAAQAYVIAHEVGHHVQNLTGTMQQMEQARARMSPAQYNQLSVRLELQADCYAGVWVHHSQDAKGWLEQGDIEGAINAAAAVGDDKLQREMQGAVRPESFTHGTSAQRMRWFRAGAQGGRIDQCDTFNAKQL
jgi:uncharacterized protein